jgi:hypothetical protein
MLFQPDDRFAAIHRGQMHHQVDRSAAPTLLLPVYELVAG